MRMLRMLVIITISLVLLLACAQTQERREELKGRFPGVSEEKIDKIAKGIVEVGMTREEAREALKSIADYRKSLEGDRWKYIEHVTSGETGNQMAGKVVFFENNTVVKMKSFVTDNNGFFYTEW